MHRCRAVPCARRHFTGVRRFPIGIDFRVVFEKSPTAVLVLSPEPALTILAATDAYLRLTGTTREGLIGRPVFEVFRDEPDVTGRALDALRASLERVLRERHEDAMAILRYDLPSPDGSLSERYWSIVNAPATDADGTLRAVLLCAEDVTALVVEGQASATRISTQAVELTLANERLRNARETLERPVDARTAELRASETRLTQLGDVMPQIVWTATPEGVVDSYNERWFEYTRQPKGGIGDASWEPVVHPEDLPRLHEVWAESLRTGRPYDTAFRLRNGATDEYRWHLSRAVPIRDEAGRIVRWIGTNTDIEDQKRAEQEVRRLSNELTLTTDAVPTHLLHLDTEERLLFVNRAVAEMWQRPREELVGRTIAEVVGEEAARALRAYTGRVLRGETVSYEAPFRSPDGEMRVYLNTYSPDVGPDGRVRGFVATGVDITSRKEVEEALRERDAKLRETISALEEEHEHRERFVSMLSHDLRTPLTAAKLSAELLARRATDPAALPRLTARIVERLERADGMIRDLLDASRVKAGEKLPLELGSCDLDTIGRDTLDELRSLHGDRFVLESDGPSEGRWSCSAVRRIIENLSSNAIKYGDPIAPVTVRLSRDETSARIEVHNEGAPIPAEELPTLFAPFRRARHAASNGHGSWGLGLTLVRGLAEAHGGSVRADSGPERGTTFTVTLPLAGPP